MGSKGGEGAAAEVVEPLLRVEQIGEFLRHFPVGARVHYYPEYQKKAKFDTIVLGYGVNGETFFSHQSLRIRRAGGAARLFAQTETGSVEVPRVDHFHFIVPHQERRELDYSAAGASSSAEAMTESVVNDFRRGNTITLINKGSGGKVPHIDAVVARVLDLRTGVFANRRVVFLEPDPGSLEFLDQRHYHRVHTRIPAVLAEDPKGEKYACSILDFSERHLRLELPPDSPLRGGTREGSRLFLIIDFQHRAQRVVLKAAAQRVTAEGLVVALQSIYKDKRFHTLDLIDELDLKTSLLHHPTTLKILHGEGA
jgi:hypothetical protein